MSAVRLFAAWLVFGSAMVAFVGFAAYDTGVLVHHGRDPSEVLYGWAAVRYLCPRIGAGWIAVTFVGGVVAALMGVGRRG